MTPLEFVRFMATPGGMIATQDAAKLLRSAGPEDDDAELIERVAEIGFPHWAARKIFHKVLRRQPTVFCRTCRGRFKPRPEVMFERMDCTKCSEKQKTPERIKQDRARGEAIRATYTGKLTRPKECSVCGSHHHLHMHHPDYDRPLYVVCLCARCHQKEHQHLRREGLQNSKSCATHSASSETVS